MFSFGTDIEDFVVLFVQNSTRHYRTVQDSVGKYRKVQYSTTVLYKTVQDSTVLYFITVLYYPVLSCTTSTEKSLISVPKENI